MSFSFVSEYLQAFLHMLATPLPAIQVAITVLCLAFVFGIKRGHPILMFASVFGIIFCLVVALYTIFTAVPPLIMLLKFVGPGIVLGLIMAILVPRPS